MIHSILLPVDGSSLSVQAIPLAIAVARATDARIKVVRVHVFPTPLPTDIAVSGVRPLDEECWGAEEDYLSDLRKRLSEYGVDISTKLLIGDPVETLRGYAAENGIDLVVMATHGRGPFSRFWLGSVADGLLRTMPKSILLWRPQRDEPRLEPSEISLRRILAPIETMETSLPDLSAVLALGDPNKCMYTVFTVVEPLSYLGFGTAVPVHNPGIADRLQKRAAACVKDVASQLRHQGRVVEETVVVNDNVPAAIIAAGNDHDLIAIATHCRRGIERLFLGSVADKVVRGAGVPVLVYRHPQP